MIELIRELGFLVYRFIYDLGRFGMFALSVVKNLFVRPLRWRRFCEEIFKEGVLSIVIICVSGLAVGMVLSLQGYNTLIRFGAEETLGAVVGLSLVRELGPVLTALLTTGRAGSATAAEIATMVKDEQLDGLRMMSIDPMHLIVTPKAASMILVMPLLSAMFICCGLFGGWMIGVLLMGIDGGTYLTSMESSMTFADDVAGSLLKSVIFGILVGLISTYRGFTATPTSEGVSSATTSTVVFASVCVLISDYFITALWGV